MLGLYDVNIAGLPMNAHYECVAVKMSEAAPRSGEWRYLFEYYEQLARVLSMKSELGIRLKSAYDAKDCERLRAIGNELAELRSAVDSLRKRHRANWFTDYKPFGWENLDIRYGGVMVRLETDAERIADYVEGKIESLAELEEMRLFYDAPWVMSEGTLGCGAYHRIVTAGGFSV